MWRWIVVGDSPPRAPRKDRRRPVASELTRLVPLFPGFFIYLMEVGCVRFALGFQPGWFSSVFFLRVLSALCGAILFWPGLNVD